MHVETAFATDVGLLRDRNEDCVSVRSNNKLGITLLAVADGIGGAPAGDVASTQAIKAFQKSAFQFLENNPKSVEHALYKAIDNANEKVIAQASKNKIWAGMGTTIVAACITESGTWIINLGDSRAYLYRNGKVELITRDHSYVEEQVQAGNMTAAQAKQSPNRNMLTQALGTEEEIQPDLFGPIKLETNDTLLLCSDGLHGVLSSTEIASLIKGRLATVSVALITAANKHGGPDNTTVALATVHA